MIWGAKILPRRPVVVTFFGVKKGQGIEIPLFAPDAKQSAAAALD